ncbi:MAG: hypothetical protein R3236_06125, partial [Phycisphaeraceae bacterium]|nr:hypothetical protein [Phycisphaeraceae bacterium]
MRRFCCLVLAFMVSGPALSAAGDLDNGLWVGYQGWHLAKGDGSPVGKWKHWFKKNRAEAEHLHGDQWPGGWDEYDPKKLYPTRMTYPDGRPVRVYSSYDFETVDVHVKWMKQYDIRGAYLQRQQNLIDRKSERAWRDQVAQNLRRACEKHGVKFSIMLANNAKRPKQNRGIVERITSDWKHLVDTVHITESRMYARQEGRPVVALWGFGNSGRPITPAEAQKIVHFFKNGLPRYRAYLVGGVSREFLDKSPNSEPLEDWRKVYASLDMITPWRCVQMVR